MTANGIYNAKSDFDLAQASARGDIKAFETLYERHHRRVYSLCLRMLANATEAEFDQIVTYLSTAFPAK